MNIAISRPSQGAAGALAVFAAAHRYGFTGVQAKPAQYTPYLNDPQRFRAEYGDLAPLIWAGLLVYWDRDHADWPCKMHELAPFAAAIGAQELCLCANVPRDSDPVPWAALAASLGEAGRIAADAGCRLSLHNHAGTVFETAADLTTIIDHLGAAPCHLTLDTAHAAKAGIADLPALVATFCTRISNIHLKDLGADGRFCPLGTGTLDLVGVLATAQHAGYAQMLTVDEESMDVDVDNAFAISRSFLDRVLAAVRS